MSATDIILSARGLTKRFSGFTAVNGVDLDVQRGTIHALIGPNGAGKTTCFNLLTKFLQPSAGSIAFNGRDITGLAPAAIARLGVVRSFQISAVFPRMSVLENVRIALQRRRGDSFDFWRNQKVLNAYDEEARERIEEVGLSDFIGEMAGELSYGRKRALEIATTLALEPAPRRAHGRHGAGGRDPHFGADPAHLGQAHHSDGRTQSLGRRRPLGPDHRAGPRRSAGRRPL
jgi:branched-chain amino acid transport system ATP-binding protein